MKSQKPALSSEASVTGNSKCSCNSYGGGLRYFTWNMIFCSVPSLTSVWSQAVAAESGLVLGMLGLDRCSNDSDSYRYPRWVVGSVEHRA